MRKQFLTIISLSVLVMAMGCKKEEKTPTTPTTPATSFTAKLNGTTVNAVSTTLVKQNGGKVLSFAAAFPYDGKDMSISYYVIDYAGAKTYEDVAVLLGSQDMSKNKSGANAVVVISKDDGTYVEGTLKGTIYKDGDNTLDSIVITDGVFKMK